MSAKVQYHALTVKYIIHTVHIHTLYLPFIINKEQKNIRGGGGTTWDHWDTSQQFLTNLVLCIALFW